MGTKQSAIDKVEKDDQTKNEDSQPSEKDFNEDDQSSKITEDDQSSDEDDKPSEDENDHHENESDYEHLQEEIKNLDDKLSILCCGPTGAGKSTLLNGLIKKNIYFDESEYTNKNKLEVGKKLERGTATVTDKVIIKNGIKITVWDTPGLEGCENDDVYLDEIKAKCSNYDSFLYCIKTDCKATELVDEASSVVKFTKLFGVELWEKAVVVLTQANGIEADLKEREEVADVKKEFKDKIQEWKEKIRACLKRLDVPDDIINKLPILPAGSVARTNLPGYRYWLSNIFIAILDQMTLEAKLKYIRFSEDKIKFRHEVKESEVGRQNIEDQPFVLPRKYKAIAGTFGVTAAVVVTGIGATIGALAIGIPTFGVGAGVGLVIGGAVGGLLGGASSAAFVLAVKYYKKKERNKPNKYRLISTCTEAETAC